MVARGEKEGLSGDRKRDGLPDIRAGCSGGGGREGVVEDLESGMNGGD